jgi:hypothetical protein
MNNIQNCDSYDINIWVSFAWFFPAIATQILVYRRSFSCYWRILTTRNKWTSMTEQLTVRLFGPFPVHLYSCILAHTYTCMQGSLHTCICAHMHIYILAYLLTHSQRYSYNTIKLIVMSRNRDEVRSSKNCQGVCHEMTVLFCICEEWIPDSPCVAPRPSGSIVLVLIHAFINPTLRMKSETY